MGTNFQLLILTLSSLLYLCKPQTINVASSTSKGDYLYVSVTLGTPPQPFKVLVDTTDHTPWVYNQSVNTTQLKFNPGKSSTFTPNGTSARLQYQTQTTEIQYANETLIIDNNYAINTTFATATTSFSITDSQQVSGFLCLDRLNNIIPSLYNKQFIQNKHLSIDVSANKLYFGQYVPSQSYINNISNAFALSNTANTELNKIWSFDIDVYINGISSYLVLGGNYTGVIDSASPYITIYAKYLDRFRALWIFIGGHYGDTLNCNYTTRICDDINLVMQWMTIVIKDVSWNISLFRDDIIVDKNIIQFFYDNDTSYTTETDYVLFLGRPFLDKVITTLDYNHETITFYSLKHVQSNTFGFGTESILKWAITGIVVIAVIGLAVVFDFNYRKKKRIKRAQQNQNLLMDSLNEQDIHMNENAYNLLKKWSLEQYEKILIDEKGYDDVEMWIDLNENELKEMGFEEDHAKKFVKMVKERVQTVLIETDVHDNQANEVELEGYTNQ
eukprot:267633_1